MTTNREIRKVKYSTLLMLFKNPGDFDPERLAQLKEYTEKELRSDLQRVMENTRNRVLLYSQLVADVLDCDPTDLEAPIEESNLGAFKYYAYYHTGCEEMIELRQYLRELKQLNNL